MSLLDQTPAFTAATAVEIAETQYDLRVSATPLPSERDQNFLLTGAGKWVLKISNGYDLENLLQGQDEVLRHLAPLALCPKGLPTRSGDARGSVVSPEGRRHWVRLVSYLPGTPLGHCPNPTPALLRDIGRQLGRVDRRLAEIDLPAFHRDFDWDLANGVATVKKHASWIRDPLLQKWVPELTSDFERRYGSLVPQLRRSTIHNDANDFNLLVEGDRLTGLIDFGDIIHSWTINDLAIALAYVVLKKEDPLAAAAEVVAGYHQAYPLNDAEWVVLFGLLRLRLCVSASMAAFQQRLRPGDAYLGLSQGPLREMLPRLAAIAPEQAEARFREAIR